MNNKVKDTVYNGLQEAKYCIKLWYGTVLPKQEQSRSQRLR